MTFFCCEICKHVSCTCCLFLYLRGLYAVVAIAWFLLLASSCVLKLAFGGLRKLETVSLHGVSCWISMLLPAGCLSDFVRVLCDSRNWVLLSLAVPGTTWDESLT